MSSTEQIIEGIPASAGIAVASIYVPAPTSQVVLHRTLQSDDEIELELQRFHSAVLGADAILGRIESMAREQISDRAEIFEALRMMLHDAALTDAITSHIRSRRSTAHTAIVEELNLLAGRFAESADETIRARAEDLHSLQSHLVSCLYEGDEALPPSPDSILVLSSLSPGDTVLHARAGAAAFVLETGGINSHAAILARAFTIPMVCGISGISMLVRSGTTIVVDGYAGRIILNPTSETIASYRNRKRLLEAQRLKLQELRHLPAETRDGDRILLAANLDMVDEIDVAIENGAEEIGLLRTEYLLMGRTLDISMEEQYRYYRQIAERAYPLTVTLRAFDIGGDKLPKGLRSETHGLPLGLRGTRLLLSYPEVLRRQVEAILRASSMKNLRLMLPMVTSADEIRQVKRVVDEVRARLRMEGVPFDEHMPIGTMIELPAAALTAETLARESSFLSIGTNDLAQYTLAVDRNDETLADYYDEFHPAVLQLIRMSVLAAQRTGVPITVCGEMAAHPLATGALIGLGIRRLSVAPPQLGPLKKRVRSLTSQEVRAWARASLQMPTAADVHSYLASCADGGDSDVELGEEN